MKKMKYTVCSRNSSGVSGQERNFFNNLDQTHEEFGQK